MRSNGGANSSTKCPRCKVYASLRRRAAEQRDELAPFQLIEMHSIPASQGRFAGYRIGEDMTVPLARNEAGRQGAPKRAGDHR